MELEKSFVSVTGTRGKRPFAALASVAEPREEAIFDCAFVSGGSGTEIVRVGAVQVECTKELFGFGSNVVESDGARIPRDGVPALAGSGLWAIAKPPSRVAIAMNIEVEAIMPLNGIDRPVAIDGLGYKPDICNQFWHGLGVTRSFVRGLKILRKFLSKSAKQLKELYNSENRDTLNGVK